MYKFYDASHALEKIDEITFDLAIKLANYFDIDVGSFISTKQISEIKNKDYIKLLKGKRING